MACHLVPSKMVRLFLKKGYIVVRGGKGSHIKLKKLGCLTITIPNHRELSKGLEKALIKVLKSI